MACLSVRGRGATARGNAWGRTHLLGERDARWVRAPTGSLGASASGADADAADDGPAGGCGCAAAGEAPPAASPPGPPLGESAMAQKAFSPLPQLSFLGGAVGELGACCAGAGLGERGLPHGKG